MEYIKEGDKLKVVEQKEEVQHFDLKDLIQQRTDFEAYSIAELAKFDTLIAEAKKLGLKEAKEVEEEIINS